MNTGNPRWCQPADVPARRWLLLFDDPDRGVAVYADEAEARAAWEQAQAAWNCYLFAAAPRAALTPTEDRNG